jgi:hypothetical protein
MAFAAWSSDIMNRIFGRFGASLNIFSKNPVCTHPVSGNVIATAPILVILRNFRRSIFECIELSLRPEIQGETIGAFSQKNEDP